MDGDARGRGQADVARVESGKGRLGEAVAHPELRVENPGWVRRQVDWTREYAGVRDRMRVALHVARLNVEQKTGAPFGAAIFERDSGRLVSVGANQAARGGSALLHAEVVAIALAEARLGRRLDEGGTGSALELHTTCEPCVMCLGAMMMCGIRHLVSAATVEDAAQVGISGGAAAAAQWAQFAELGGDCRSMVLRDEAREILALWRATSGPRQGSRA